MRSGGALVDAMLQKRIVSHNVSRLDEGSAIWVARFHLGAADTRECVHIELVVGEDNEVLEMLWGGAGIVVEPVQGIVDPSGAEHGKRYRSARQTLHRAINDRIVDRGKIRRIKNVLQ
jgi:hypothetical protein